MAAKIEHLYLKVRTRRGISFESEIQSLTGFNEVGTFDVLRKHTQFISHIRDKIIVRMLDGSTKNIPVENSIMRVKGENVLVFIGIKQRTA